MNKFSPNFNEAVLSSRSTLMDCLASLTKSGLLIVCISSAADSKLLGILTDSDIRRALLRGASLNDFSEKWMNVNPVIGSFNSSANQLFDLAHRVGKREIPLVDDFGKIVDIYILGLHDIRFSDNVNDEIQLNKCFSNYIFILAGGLGTRLKSIINDRPKPLAVVGGKPIIETLVNRAYKQGFKNFYISTNYLANQIEEFLSTSKFADLNFHFVREKIALGTAGSIGLINNFITEPLIVCNADILSNIQYNKILEEHEKNRAEITCVVRPFQYKVPYGVVEIGYNNIMSLSEKPTLNFLVNAGIYVLNPDITRLINSNKYLDMTDFIKMCISDGKKVIPYLLHEYWIDIGHPEEYLKANSEYHLYFKG
ncbi:nucleotidyltransferase family protein [Fluviispira vulneris]|uniref:nucleotidyltransferase family protein n=1 Tax=Fluviispira vulneris TaxID=2763012 RepID=UPI001646EA09|nr:nucleotidyltransferase family protein [Fluviispira vulneris]